MAKVAPRKECVLGIDIGATKVRSALYTLENGKLSQDPIEGTVKEEPVAKNPEASKSQIGSMMEKAQETAGSKGYTLTGAGIGFPGRIRNDVVIEPYGAPNMPDFEGHNMLKEYQNVAPTGVQCGLLNDATAQMLGILKDMKANKPDEFRKLLPESGEEYRVVGYIGIGTGMGNMYAKIDKKGNIELVTDGHASKFLLPLNNKELEWMQERKKVVDTHNAKPENTDNQMIPPFLFGEQTIGDSLVSGTAIEHLTEYDGKTLDEGHKGNKGLAALWDRAVDSVGRGLATIISIIKKENVRDIMDIEEKDGKWVDKPDQRKLGWTPEFRQIASEASVYLLAGGTMQGKIGTDIMNKAKEDMQTMGLDDIALMPASDLHAMRAAAASAPVQEKSLRR